VTQADRKCPISVMIVSALYIAVGVLGTGAHIVQSMMQKPAISETFWTIAFEVTAVVAGVYMVRGRNWARWLALAWMAAHVAISIFHSRQELIIHSVLLVVIGYLLLRPAAREYFSLP
jgi:hypothetical protein